jgi:hypothetical protein
MVIHDSRMLPVMVVTMLRLSAHTSPMLTAKVTWSLRTGIRLMMPSIFNVRVSE